MSGSPPATRPWFAEFVLLAAIWGSSFLFTRLAVVEFGALPTAGVRVAIASLFLLPIVLWRGLGPQLRQHWKLTFLVGLTNSAIPFACFSYALLSITTGLVLKLCMPLSSRPLVTVVTNSSLVSVFRLLTSDGPTRPSWFAPWQRSQAAARSGAAAAEPQSPSPGRDRRGRPGRASSRLRRR